jgi:catechol 2,3-dioxygenase-like lactoylglutathione lyase family enzyme
VTAGAAGTEAATPYSGLDDRPKLLRHVAMVTHCVPDLDRVVAAWRQYLDYRLLATGTIGADLAAAWDAPGAAGARFALLGPASGQDCAIRFIETAAAGGYGPPMTCGWNATELLVQDVDALARSFRGSPFTVLGGPGDLYPRPRAPRAMQVRGPAGELVYFTRLYPAGSRYGLKPARSPVDRPFIVTVGGRSSDAMEHFYGSTLGQRVMDRMPFINTILAHGCGVPYDTVFPTSIVRIPGRSFLVELDEYPPSIADRPRQPGCLPGGMAMVSFHVDQLDTTPVPLRAPPRPIAGAGYAGRRTGVIMGAAGEWLELIETGAKSVGEANHA